eukprot:TRINITY_DN13957_c0_g1_i1.p1 TRINITY_DN13957_c0_g1~~TRINITY_DN13957_c0_g1_i1.p1  ORF type:complete len:491 (+),score=81.14 TRINITY_DN13957_c0_g1_i1:73-1545(+)
MPSCPKRCLDLDDLFAYRTPRTVLIRDRKLGLSRIILALALFLYIVVYEVIMKKGYLEKELPVGWSKISFRPGNDATNSLLNVYCCSFPGCQESAFGSPVGKLNCIQWDYHNAIVPPAEEFSGFLTTRVSVTKYAPVLADCVLNEGLPGCGFVAIGDKTSYYPVDPEKYTVLVKHAIYGAGIDLVLTSTENMPKARLAGADGEYVRNFCDNSANPDMDTQCADDNGYYRLGDIMTIGEILDSAGVFLDPATGTRLDKQSGTGLPPFVQGVGFVQNSELIGTLRYDGMVVVCLIDYAGTSAERNTVKYTYRMKHIPYAEHKYEEVKDRYVTDPNTGVVTVHREVWNRHGIRIITVAAGWMGKFSFVELMKTLVTGLGLLAIANTFTDYIVLRLLPMSAIYRRYKNVRSVDFSDIQEKKERRMKPGKDLTWGGTYITDEAFVYGELSDDEKEVADKVRVNASAERDEKVGPYAGQQNGSNPLQYEYGFNPAV